MRCLSSIFTAINCDHALLCSHQQNVAQFKDSCESAVALELTEIHDQLPMENRLKNTAKTMWEGEESVNRKVRKLWKVRKVRKVRKA